MNYKYSKIQFEAAVKFISTNNINFLGKDEEIAKSLIQSIKSLLSIGPDNL